LVYNKNEHPGDNDEIGGAIFDLLCTRQAGENFLIEVQRSSQTNLKQRMLYYASRLISDMDPKGNGQRDAECLFCPKNFYILLNLFIDMKFYSMEPLVLFCQIT
jgi:hypothetical protein